MSNDGRILLSKEEAARKSAEKKAAIGIVFENINNGEVRVATTTEHIAAFFNSSDEGPNAKNKQDFGWRLAPEDLIELERLKNDPETMERIANIYQIPPEDVADYNVLKFMAGKRFAKAKQEAEASGKDYESDYERRVRELREGKKSKSQQRRETALKDDEKPADKKPAITTAPEVKPNDDKKVANSDSKPDNKSNS